MVNGHLTQMTQQIAAGERHGNHDTVDVRSLCGWLLSC